MAGSFQIEDFAPYSRFGDKLTGQQRDQGQLLGRRDARVVRPPHRQIVRPTQITSHSMAHVVYRDNPSFCPLPDFRWTGSRWSDGGPFYDLTHEGNDVQRLAGVGLDISSFPPCGLQVFALKR